MRGTAIVESLIESLRKGVVRSFEDPLIAGTKFSKYEDDLVRSAIRDGGFALDYYATLALGEIGDPRAIKPLLHSGQTRELAQIIASLTVDDCIQMLQDPDSAVRDRAIVALSMTDNRLRAIVPLVKAILRDSNPSIQ